jgi:hypothetical protein
MAAQAALAQLLEASLDPRHNKEGMLCPGYQLFPLYELTRLVQPS